MEKHQDMSSRAAKLKMAYQYKQEGNDFFKQKDYDRAIAKYTRVSIFTKALLPLENKELAQYMSKANKEEEKNITPEEINEIKELDSVTYSNMAEAFLQQGRFRKAIEKASLSIASKESGKAYFRRGKAQVATKDYKAGIEDFKKAKELMPDQAANIDAEIKKAMDLEKAHDKEQFKKYAGFFSKLDKS